MVKNPDGATKYQSIVAPPANTADNRKKTKTVLKKCRLPKKEKVTRAINTVPHTRTNAACHQIRGGKNNTTLKSAPIPAPNNNRHRFTDKPRNRAVADNSRKSTHKFKMKRTSMYMTGISITLSTVLL